MRYVIICLSLVLSICLAATTAAQTTDPLIKDPAIDAQAREIGQSLRCVVCQNQSINDSDAPLAQDMRKLIRKQLEDGKSKTDIIDYMQENYGDYVLLKPPVQGNTLILWFGPFLLLLALLLWFIRTAKKNDVKRRDTEAET